MAGAEWPRIGRLDDPEPVVSPLWGRYLSTHWLDDCLLVTLDDPSGRANKTSDLFKTEFDALMHALETGLAPAGLLFRSAKPSFGVGGDIGQVLGYAQRGIEASLADSEAIKSLFRRLERLPCPSVAVLEGTAAGGGWELALACNARFCIAGGSIRLGLPEVEFGLVPGAGGMLRLPHLVGLESAGRLIAGAAMLSPEEAFAHGLLTGLAADGAALLKAGLDWLGQRPDQRRPWDRAGYAIVPSLSYDGPVAGAPGGQAAPRALSALATIAEVPFDEAGRIESRCFAECATSNEARALVGLGFYDRNRLRHATDDERAALARVGRRLGCVKERLTLPSATGPDDETPDEAEYLAVAQAAEALRILGEESALPAAIVNVASVEQAGFPRRTGGALRFIAGMGTQAFLARAETLARRFGAPFHIDIAADDAARLLSDAESRNHQGETG